MVDSREPPEHYYDDDGEGIELRQLTESEEYGIEPVVEVEDGSAGEMEFKAMLSDEEDFDYAQFVRDGRDIRFQLPSHQPDIIPVSRHTSSIGHAGTTVRRRKTTLGHRGRSAKGPPIDRSTKPPVRQPSQRSSSTTSQVDQDEVDLFVETDILMSPSEQFEQLDNIKSLTLPMGQKRKYRHELQNCKCSDDHGLTLAYYRTSKHRGEQMRNLKKAVNNAIAHTEIWRGTFKEIEAQFGAGIMEYFKLLKWMVLLNLILALAVLPIIVPQLIISPQNYEDTFSDFNKTYQNALNRPTIATTPAPTTTTNKMFQADSQTAAKITVLHDYYGAVRCTKEYTNIVMQPLKFWYTRMLDFFQGTGFLEDTPLFYGFYFNKTSNIDPTQSSDTQIHPWYNLSIGYLISFMVFFLMSLFFIVASTSRGLTQNVVASDMLHSKSINKVFAGWDYGLYKEKAARIKKSLIRHELMRDIAEERRQILIDNRTDSDYAKIVLRRICINLLIVCILVGCGVAVYFTQIESTRRLRDSNPFMTLIWQYLPSVLITVMYAVWPLVFNKLAKLEQYYPATELNITIARIVLLRLATVFLLLIPVFVRIIECQEKTSQACHCDGIYCWETFIGQQVYKLVLLDFLVHIAVVFLIEFPRKAIWKRFEHVKLIAAIGEEEFDIPVNVMDVVYTQTLCWVGAFYSPLIPIITFFKVLIFFYMKKLSLFYNQKPAATPYRASSMHLFFMFVLTISFILGIIVVGLSIGIIPPSQSCGPFRTHSSISEPFTMFGVISEALLTSDTGLRDLITFLTSAVFQVSIIVVLCLLVYIYSAISNGQTRLVEILHETLKREEKDKHWLLSKVNSTLRRELGSA